MTEALARAPLGLLPALTLLAVLPYLDGYRPVKLRAVLALLACGALLAAAASPVDRLFLEHLELPLSTFARYVAPVSEELLKALVVVALIRGGRIRLLMDAAVFGFALGTGFAVAENLHLLFIAPGVTLSSWVLRGFGTALMHGGASALFGVMGLPRYEQRSGYPRAFLPGLGLAVLLHSGFNLFFLSARLSALFILLVLPPLLYLVYRRSESSLRRGRGSPTTPPS